MRLWRERDAALDAEDFTARTAGLYQRVGAVVLALCGDRSLAEDCAQEALMRAWIEVERGTPLRDLDAWTVRVALNWCRSQLRRTGAEQRALRRAGAPSGDADQVSVDDDIRDAVRCLPFRQREAVVLHYVLDMDIRSIAAATGRSQGAVKNALFNARAALRSTMVDVERAARPKRRIMSDPLDEAISRSLRTALSEFPSPDPAVLAEALESRRNTVGRHRRPVVALVAAAAVMVTALTTGVVLLSGDDAGRDIVASRGRSAPTRAKWTQLPVDGVPPMSGMSTAVLGSRLVVAGTVSGTLEKPPRAGAVELEVGSQRWAALPAPPLGRFEMVGAGDHLVIVGVTAVDDDSVVSWATWRDGAEQWSAPMPLPPTAVTATRDALLEPTGISRRFEGTEMVWTGTHVIDTHYGVALDPDTAMAEPLAVPSDDLTPYMHLNGGTPVWTGDAVVLSTWSKGPGLAWSSGGRSVTEVPGLPDALVTGPVGLTTAATVDGTVVISTGLADPSAQFAVLDPDRAGWEPLSAPPDPTDPLCGWRLAVVSGKVAAQGCAGAPAGYGDVWLLDSKTWTNAGGPPDPLACCSEHSWTGTDSELFVAGQSTARPRRGSENEAPDPALALMTTSGG